MKSGKQVYIVGIDEVGRGALAGPVVVAAVAIPKELRVRNYELGKLKDSKRLSSARREKWAAYIKSNSLILSATARVSEKIIDRINITNAANLAATRAFLKLATSHWGIATRAKVILDGGLYLNKNTLLANGYTLNPKTIIKGDEKYNAIKLASIAAKVRRDRLMAGKYHKLFPQYGFAAHKGYGTKRHLSAIKKCGPAPLHRLTFLVKYLNI